jgi:hypothetical protein
MSDQKKSPTNIGYKPVEKGYVPQNKPTGTPSKTPPGAGYQPISQGDNGGTPPAKP